MRKHLCSMGKIFHIDTLTKYIIFKTLKDTERLLKQYGAGLRGPKWWNRKALR